MSETTYEGLDMSETPFFFEVVDLRTGEIVKLTEKEYDHFAGRANVIAGINNVVLWGVAAWEPPDLYGHDKRPGEPVFEVYDLGAGVAWHKLRLAAETEVRE